MFYTYIIYSKSKDKFYVGATENLNERLRKHNSKNKGFTNICNDWEFVFVQKFYTKIDALNFEKEIKGWKSKIKIKKLIQNSNFDGLEHSDA